MFCFIKKKSPAVETIVSLQGRAPGTRLTITETSTFLFPLVLDERRATHRENERHKAQEAAEVEPFHDFSPIFVETDRHHTHPSNPRANSSTSLYCIYYK